MPSPVAAAAPPTPEKTKFRSPAADETDPGARLGDDLDGEMENVGREVTHLDDVDIEVANVDREAADLDREVAELLSPRGGGAVALATGGHHAPAAGALDPGQQRSAAAMVEIDALFEEALGGGL